MKYLLDSDVIIDLLNNKDPGLKLIRSLSSNDLAISIITWIEIVYGIEKGKSERQTLKQFSGFIRDFNVEVLPLDQNVAINFIEIKRSLEKIRQLLADFDLLIAATAEAHDLTLVTRNIKHFERIKRLKIYKIKNN